MCILYGLIVPERPHMTAFLEVTLPGFTWLTPGGFLIGLVESLGAGYYPDPSRALNYKTAFGLVIFALVLLFRPRGFFGRKEA